MSLTVTDQALGELQRIVQTKRLPTDRYLKLSVPPEWTGPGDFGVVIDTEKGGEIMYQCEGQTVLAIDPGLEENLKDAVFDFKETPNGMGFTLDVY